MSKANELLHKTSLSLWEISSLLGYQQLTSFNAAYKRWTGRTPASQRKKMLSKN
jgi:AraC-like DNA-binding protein